MNFSSINEVKALLNKYGFNFSKALGQNFLISPHIPQKIAEESGINKNCGIIEIGPGIGTLTDKLCEASAKVCSIEIDKKLLPLLTETMANHDNFTLYNDDVLKADLNKIAADNFENLHIHAVANLPYYITTPAIIRLIESCIFESITVMVQKEVALRMIATEKDKEYGSFSVFINFYSKPKLLFTVAPTCFIPAPKVHSAVVRLDLNQKNNFKHPDQFFKVVRAAFGQRRKTLLNALSTEFDKEIVKKAIANCKFPPNIRGEALNIKDFERLTEELWNFIF